MARRFKTRVPVLGMAGLDGTGAMKRFVKKHRLGFLDHAVDADGDLWASFGVRVQPAWVFIDRDGEVTVQFGPLSEKDLARRLKRIAKS